MTTVERQARIQAECICGHGTRDAVGTHDTVTNEWLPDKPTTIVWLIPHPDCPWHPSFGCHACDKRTVYLPTRGVDQLEQGWSRRADAEYFACPEHQDSMPPS